MSSSEQQPPRNQVLPASSEKRRTLTVLNLSFVTFLVMLGLNIVAPILPTYAEDFDVSYALVGFVISSFAVTRMLLDIPAGFLSRKYNKKAMMISGLALLSGSSVLAGFAPSYNILVAARMMEGAGSALYVTTATVFLAQIAGKERRGTLMSMYTGMLLLGSVFGPTLGGFIATTYDIHAPFFAYAIVAALGVIPTLRLPSWASSPNVQSSHGVGSSVRDMSIVLRHPSFLLATFATFSLFFIRTGVRSTLVPLFAANNLGLDSSAIGLLLTIAGIATAITMVPTGGISDRIGRKSPLMLCLLLTAAVTLLIPYSDSLMSLSLSMTVYGATVGLSGPMAAYVTDVSPQDKLEVSLGLYRMIGDLGFIAGPLLLGYVSDVDVALSGKIGVLPFIVTSILLVSAGLVLLRADDPARRQMPEPNQQEKGAAID